MRPHRLTWAASALLTALLSLAVTAAAQESTPKAAAPAAVVAAPPAGFTGPYYPTPPPLLGINIDIGYVWGGNQWESGVRVLTVWPGYPAWGRLDPGDIITRVNGIRTRNIDEFRYAMSMSGGVINLRVRDIRTGSFLDMYPIAVSAYGPAAAAAAVAPPATGGP